MFKPHEHLEAERGLERLKSFLSPYSGVVHRVHEIMGEPDDARMAYVACELASRAPTLDSRFELSAGGAHYRRDLAIAAALGEALERYCATWVPSGTVLASADELGPDAVAPQRFTLFSHQQYGQPGFPYEPFTSDTRVRWVRGRSLPEGEDAYLPLQLTHIMPPGQLAPGEAAISPGSSNGLALAAGGEEAVLGGLFELIERDAVMLTWAGRHSFPRLDWSSDPALAERDSRHFVPTGLRYEAVDLSAFFGVPTALSLLRGPEGGPTRFGIGAAGAATMAEACDKALRECFQMQPALKSDLRSLPDPGFPARFDEITEPAHHVYFYARAENQGELDFLDGSPEVRDIASVAALEGETAAARIEAIAERLRARGASAYAVDVTTPDVEASGLRVMHVISPELQPVDFEHRLRFLGGQRLYRALYELGLRERPLGPDDLNPYPHPFP